MLVGAHLPVAAIGLVAILVCACGPGTGKTTATTTSTPTATSTAAETPSPTSDATPDAAGLTAKQAADQIAKGSGQACMTAASRLIVMGQGAASFSYSGGPCGPGGHFIFFAYVFQDAAGWQPRNWTGTQCCSVPGYTVPGSPFAFTLSRGCLNVHSSPGLTAHVVVCLASGTQVETTGAPVYMDGHIWWRLLTGTFSPPPGTREIGWADHDLLLCGSAPPAGNASYC
jgi:hypothetical protein